LVEEVLLSRHRREVVSIEARRRKFLRLDLMNVGVDRVGEAEVQNSAS